VRLSIFSYSSPDISEKLAKCDYDLTRRYEFVLDLDRTEEQLWRGLSKTLRKNINRAKRTGVTIRELPAGESIASLVKLSAESADMIERRKGIDLRQSNIGVYQSAAMFLEAGRGRFFSAVADGEIVSTSLFTLFNGVVNHNLAGSSEQAYIINAPKYLLWHAILSYKVEGAGVFNLGGVKADATEPDSLEHGVYDYKRAFGTRILECASGEKILGTKRVKFINLVKSIARG
jgi:lipid II:glycine glycyltransferase (peptidoglycan interpeptide bridge formation enzyme)